jgi:TRAP transporter TAXI family solute receptor
MGVVAGTLLLSGCSAGHQAPDPAGGPRHLIRVGASFSGARIDGSTQTIKPLFERHYPEFQIEWLATQDSAGNILALQRDEAELVLTFAPLAYLAFNGQWRSVPEHLDRLRGVATLETLPLQLIVRRGLRVSAIPDLRDKRVGIGPSGSECLRAAELVVGAYGLKFDDFKFENLPFDTATDELLRARLDASLVCGGYPNPAVTAATRGGGRLLEITGAPIADLHARYPFLKLVSIPAGTYPGTGAVRTIGPNGLLATRSTLSEDDVYKLTRAFFLTLPNLPIRVDIRRAPATSVPLHPGAARYYREQEIRR